MRPSAPSNALRQNLIIIGAGPFGREVCTWAEQAIDHGARLTIKGFLDDRSHILDAFDHYPPVLDSAEAYKPEPDDVFLSALGDPKAKQHYTGEVLAKNGVFTTLVHPTAVIGPSVTIGAGSIICPLTQMSCDIELGRFVTLGTFSCVAHNSVIEDYVQISGHCGINGDAVIEEGAFLGSHAVILPRAKVGAWAYVGAGSVVLKRVHPGYRVFGNPAMPI